MKFDNLFCRISSFWIVVLLLFMCTNVMGESKVEDWKITGYCSCSRCCSVKWSDGYMASGIRCKKGYIACNILPFGTQVKIEGLGVYEVQDRGASRYFDGQKHIDVYFDGHDEAIKFGVQYLQVEIIK